MSSFTSSTAKRISQIPHKFPKFKPFSQHKPQTKPLNNGHHHELRASQMENSIYNLLTIDGWESLNHMDYKLASLRPVHGKLALRFLNWVVKNPGLELTHFTHSLCLTAHVLVKARMYDDAKALIDGHCNKGNFEEALRLLVRTEAVGLRPNEVSYGALNFKWIIAGFVPNNIIYSTLIYNFWKMGNVAEALKVFSVMNCNGHDLDQFTFNVLVASLCRDGKVGEAEDFMHHMRRTGLVPNSVTYDCIINGHGMLGKGLKTFSVFDEMIKLGHHPSHFIYGSLLKGLCKGGNLQGAKQFLNKLHYIPSTVDTIAYNTVIS
ncbi:hypothetical protein Pint_03833 [Pistacia integerrima]|uniref:Uncharacterized protein n=1 Tax=Pistacia integerrima TaxID=434235 RepID=A0ACC0Z9H5_9ROSI|nr:hypothetical protein Pint_03833 [Pistacia integerrima]